MLHTTPQERLALGVVALLISAGSVARLLRADAAAVEWSGGGIGADTTQSGAPPRLREAVTAELERGQVRDRPLAPGERIDPNTARAEELERLPRVGPALAARIVAWRTERGPFRTLADLDSVAGVGPAMLASLAPHLTLRAGAPAPPGQGGRIDLNRATAAELEALPGIGPALAARILAWRRENGSFGSLDELEKVPGIGPSLRGRLAAHLRVGS